MMQTIEKLKQRKDSLVKEVGRINDQLQELGTKEAMPGLKKKYEGKYFKYDNGFNRQERWWLYSYCKKVVGIRDAIFDQFETTKDFSKANRFGHNETCGLFLCQQEITKQEYMRELKKMTAKLNKLYSKD